MLRTKGKDCKVLHTCLLEDTSRLRTSHCVHTERIRVDRPRWAEIRLTGMKLPSRTNCTQRNRYSAQISVYTVTISQHLHIWVHGQLRCMGKVDTTEAYLLRICTKSLSPCPLRISYITHVLEQHYIGKENRLSSSNQVTCRLTELDLACGPLSI